MHIVGELVGLNHLHFVETGSPLSWIRALHIGRHLSPDDPRLVWAQTCLADAISRLDALTHPHHQPPEKEKHWDSIIEALGFQMRPNHNPFREISRMLERDKVYAAVLQELQHGKKLTREGGALSTVARAQGLSKRKVMELYYDGKKRVEQLFTK
jgi:hypothetical protein